jgi:hypothetical protein
MQTEIETYRIKAEKLIFLRHKRNKSFRAGLIQSERRLERPEPETGGGRPFVSYRSEREPIL